MSTIDVHKAKQTDFKAMKAILNDAVQFKLSKGDGAWGSEAWTDDEVAEAIGFGNTNIVLVNNAVVGCVDLIWEDVYNWGKQLGSDGLAGYLHRLSVLSDFKDKGLGEEIVNWVMTQARAKGRRYVRLDCHADNSALCKYYEKLGFQRVHLVNPNKTNTAFFQKEVN